MFMNNNHRRHYLPVENIRIRTPTIQSENTLSESSDNTINHISVYNGNQRVVLRPNLYFNRPRSPPHFEEMNAMRGRYHRRLSDFINGLQTDRHASEADSTSSQSSAPPPDLQRTDPQGFLNHLIFVFNEWRISHGYPEIITAPRTGSYNMVDFVREFSDDDNLALTYAFLAAYHEHVTRLLFRNITAPPDEVPRQYSWLNYLYTTFQNLYHDSPEQKRLRNVEKLRNRFNWFHYYGRARPNDNQSSYLSFPTSSSETQQYSGDSLGFASSPVSEPDSDDLQSTDSSQTFYTAQSQLNRNSSQQPRPNSVHEGEYRRGPVPPPLPTWQQYLEAHTAQHERRRRRNNRNNRAVALSSIINVANNEEPNRQRRRFNSNSSSIESNISNIS